MSREYYINDAGNQINNLALSVEVRYFEALGLEKPMPEDGYRGEDIIAIGKSLPKISATVSYMKRRANVRRFSVNTA